MTTRTSNDPTSETRLLLAPTSEARPTQRERIPRPEHLRGLHVGLLDISKARGYVFLDRIEEQLVERGATVERFSKPTFTKPAPTALLQDIASRCGAVIEALAD